jgi:hypothetical protein
MNEIPMYTSSGGFHSPLAWGVMFEKVTVSMYEYIHGVTVGAFGCIVHPHIPYIGASPDGIVVSPGERYGRMIEIKNIYNREITGIPKDEYWVQMQVQMEVCDLPLCDFVETRCCLYPSYDAWKDDDNDFRGAIIDTNGTYTYYYLWHFHGNVDECAFIIHNECKRTGGMAYWWYVDEYSCVYVQRHREWFASIVPYIEETWNIIEQRRRDGICEEKPSRRSRKGQCLVELEDHMMETTTQG